MSGHSYSDPCPNCGGQANYYQDHKPFQLNQFDCLDCGVYSHVTLHQQDLNELNESRKDSGDFDDGEYEPVKELPKVNENLKHWFPKEDKTETRIYGISNDYMDKMDWGENDCRKMSDKDFMYHSENDGCIWSDIKKFVSDINDEGGFGIFRVIKVKKL